MLKSCPIFEFQRANTCIQDCVEILSQSYNTHLRISVLASLVNSEREFIH